MATVRSVRFSEEPAITHLAESNIVATNYSNYPIQTPRIYDDALYSPYDIYTAASIGDVEIIETQLKSRFNPNRLNGSSWSALMYASYLGHESACSVLIKYGANINLPNQKGQTALMLASTCGNLAVVRLLISKGCEIDVQNSSGETALAYATACSQTCIVEALLEAGADPNVPNVDGMTPALTACAIGHELTLLAILQNNGNVKLKNKKGEDGEALAADSPKALAIINDPPMAKNSDKRKVDDIKTLSDLLTLLNLEKYIGTFENENIDLKLFLQLNDKDLAEMGVKAFGPRKKMLNVINRYCKDGTLVTNMESDYRPEIENKDGGSSERRYEQVTKELIDCQQNLSECQQELRKARKIIIEQQKVLDWISESGKTSRQLIYNMLEDMRRNCSHAMFENDIIVLMRSIDNMAMKILELPRL